MPRSSSILRRRSPHERNLTRRELLQRAAAGGAVLLAARAPRGLRRRRGEASGGATAATAAGELADRLRFSNWPLLHRHRREDEEARRRWSSSRRRPASRSTTSRTSTTTPSTSGRSRDRSRRAQSIDRDIIVMTDNSRFPGLLDREGLAGEARQEPRSRTSRTCSPRSGEPAVRPRPVLQHAVVVRHHRDRHQPKRPAASRSRPSTSCSRIRS